LNLGSFKEAIKCFDTAIELDPTILEAWGNKGEALNALNRTTEAVASLGKSGGRSGFRDDL